MVFLRIRIANGMNGSRVPLPAPALMLRSTPGPAPFPLSVPVKGLTGTEAKCGGAMQLRRSGYAACAFTELEKPEPGHVQDGNAGSGWNLAQRSGTSHYNAVRTAFSRMGEGPRGAQPAHPALGTGGRLLQPLMADRTGKRPWSQ